MSADSWASAKPRSTSGRRIRASRRERAASAAIARGREWPAQTPGRGPVARQTHPVRSPEKKSLRPTQRRELAGWVQVTFAVSCVRACHLAQFSRAAWYRRSHAKDQTALRVRIRELAHVRPRFGFLRIWVLLRREGWLVNKKRVRRLYRLEGLQLRMRVRRRKHIALHRGPAPVPAGPTERWSMDFVHDALADGRPFRVLTVVDQWSRQSPMLEVASSMSGATVGVALDRVLPAGACAALDHRRSRHGVHVTRARRLGLSARRAAGFHSPGQTRGKCLHRIV